MTQTKIAEANDLYDDKHFIETYTGERFNILKPEVNIIDIGHALSMVCRYGGHCSRFYSVAEHSILVHDLMKKLYPNEDPLEGLLHDASEAYLGDMPAPFKNLMPDFKKYENAIDAAVRDRYALKPVRSNGEKACDLIALFIEAEELIADGGDCFIDPYRFKGDAARLADEFPIHCYSPVEARTKFLELAKTYGI